VKGLLGASVKGGLRRPVTALEPMADKSERRRSVHAKKLHKILGNRAIMSLSALPCAQKRRNDAWNSGSDIHRIGAYFTRSL
jgi:hypothetical protein